MKLTDVVHLVGSGQTGIHLTNAFDCHVYLIDAGDALALVDAGAGMGCGQILDEVRNSGFSPEKIKYLLLTHAHADHAGGARDLMEHLDLQVIASSLAANYLERGDENAISLSAAKNAGFYPADYVFKSCKVHRRVSDGDEIAIGSLTLKVLETPGHCSGHVSYYMETAGRNYLFAGDAVFHGGKIAIQHIYDCNVFDYGNSLKKLAQLPVDALLPGHETFVLREGNSHIQQGASVLDRLALPISIIH